MASVSRPERAGCGEGTNLPDRWSAEENVAWKRDVPGRRWSSPIVWGSRVFLTTVSPVNNGRFLLATAGYGVIDVAGQTSGSDRLNQ